MTELNPYSFCMQADSELATFLPLSQQMETATCCQVKTRKCQEKGHEETLDFYTIISMGVVARERGITG